MKSPSHIPRDTQGEWKHGKFTEYAITAKRLHVFNSPLQHRLKHIAGIISGGLKQGSRQSFKPGKLIQELHSKMGLRLGVHESRAAIDGKEGEKLNPSRAALLAMVDNRLDSDAVHKDSHHK